MRVKLLLTLFVLLFLVGSTLALILFFTQQQTSTQQQKTQEYIPRTGKFYVLGNKIIDPNGNRFIIKGVNDLFGIWDGQNVGLYGSLQFDYAKRDFATMKEMGVNYLRIWESNQIMTNAKWQSQLDNGIHLAEQQGFVVELTCACSGETVQNNVKFVRYLASRYKADPYVWIEPVNEPDCYDNVTCNDWSFWHNEWSQYIQTIRAQGFQNPIIIQTPWWSSMLRKFEDPSITIDTPGYTFSDTNLIYSMHVYPSNSNSWTLTDSQNQDFLWGNYAASHAVIVDEFGPQNTGAAYEGWIRGFLDYLANWVNNRNGSGAVSFLWFWLSKDSMTGTNLGSYSNRPALNQWGDDYKTRYLDKVVTN